MTLSSSLPAVGGIIELVCPLLSELRSDAAINTEVINILVEAGN